MNGSTIREKRKEKNISQSKLSDIIGVSQAQISKWELEKKDISKKRLEDILSKIDSLTEDEIRKINKKRIRHKGKTNRSYSYPKSKSDRCVRECDTSPEFQEYRLVNKWKKRETNNDLRAVSLFSGCGGMSLGFKLDGYNVLGYVEKEESFKKIYESNFQSTERIGSDIKDIRDKEISQWKDSVGDIDIVFGGPPCQGFSLAGKRDEEDPRNQLFREYARVVRELKPDVILMENVRLLTSMDAPDGRKVVDHIKEALSRSGYVSDFAEIDAQYYGVPQSRERVFFLGLRKDKGYSEDDISFPSRTHGATDSLFSQELKPVRTFKEATSDLESLESGEESGCDPWHFAVSHPPHVIKWLENVPEGRSAHENDDPELRPNSGYNTTYKRIRSDEPCSTISTNFGMISGSRNVHPRDTRSFTVREAMRVQTFPDDFKVFGNLSDVRNAIGNAVPPLLAYRFAKHINDNLLS
jgi:DNA (cytosine-5)-methyltransferase 1